MRFVHKKVPCLNEINDVIRVNVFHFIRSFKEWPPLINPHSFMQTLTNQKTRAVSSWLLIGLNLHERMCSMGINQKQSHFWAPCCNKPIVITEPAVPSARLLGLCSKLNPRNIPRMLDKYHTRFMQSLSRVRQNRVIEIKSLLVGRQP